MPPVPSPGSAVRESRLSHPIDWSRLDDAAYRVSVKRSVRRFAWTAGILSAVVVGGAIAGSSPPLAALGLLMLGACAWNLGRTAVTGLLVDGGALVLVGAGFIAYSWVSLGGLDGGNANKAMLTGLLQMAWGARRIWAYRTARQASHDPEAMTALEALIGELSKRNARTDDGVVEFWTPSRFRHRSRIGLYPEGSIALLEHQAVRLERRSDIWIETRGTTALGRSIKVEIQMSDLQLAGEMPTEHFQRFERWKLGMPVSRSAAA